MGSHCPSLMMEIFLLNLSILFIISGSCGKREFGPQWALWTPSSNNQQPQQQHPDNLGPLFITHQPPTTNTPIPIPPTPRTPPSKLLVDIQDSQTGQNLGLKAEIVISLNGNQVKTSREYGTT